MAAQNIRKLVSVATGVLIASTLILQQVKAEDTSAKTSTTADSATESAIDAITNQAKTKFDETQSNAFMLIMNGKNDEARKLVEDAIAKSKGEAKQADLYYLMAAIEKMSDNTAAAIKDLNIVLKTLPAPKSNEDFVNAALLHKRLGDCYYSERTIPAAISSYTAALADCQHLAKNSSLTAAVLEALTGTYTYDKQYATAETFGKKLLEIRTEKAKSGLLDDIGALFWARIQLLGIYRHEGKEEERKKLAAESTVLLDKLLALRAQIDASDTIPELEKLKTEFEQRYIIEFHPTTPAEYLWLADEFKMRTMPLIQWPAKTAKAKAAMLCIHGLGLDNRSFTDFAREMANRGISVYALDVRGFGSWQTTQGQEDVQFGEAIKDIGAVLTLIKQRENLPTFLLGESMGGAIALRGAAAFGDLMAGLISSVPSAERFQEKRMGFSVAYHLLQGKNKPFRVGDMVTAQATSSASLTKKWKADYKAKMDMSPKELIKFAIFMRTTKRECEHIKTTPVFVIQGLKDKLVKPQGTFELFDAVASDDKILFIVSKEEHLIFEGASQSKLILDTLDTWIDQHLPAKAKAAE